MQFYPLWFSFCHQTLHNEAEKVLQQFNSDVQNVVQMWKDLALFYGEVTWPLLLQVFYQSVVGFSEKQHNNNYTQQQDSDRTSPQSFFLCLHSFAEQLKQSIPTPSNKKASTKPTVAAATTGAITTTSDDVSTDYATTGSTPVVVEAQVEVSETVTVATEEKEEEASSAGSEPNGPH